MRNSASIPGEASARPISFDLGGDGLLLILVGLAFGIVGSVLVAKTAPPENNVGNGEGVE